MTTKQKIWLSSSGFLFFVVATTFLLLFVILPTMERREVFENKIKCEKYATDIEMQLEKENTRNRLFRDIAGFGYLEKIFL